MHHSPDGLNLDAKDFFVSLAPMVVRRPESTHIIKTATKNGRRRYFVVDRKLAPQEGELIIIATRYRHKLARYVAHIPRESIWGTIVWILQEGA